METISFNLNRNYFTEGVKQDVFLTFLFAENKALKRRELVIKSKLQSLCLSSVEDVI